MLVALQQIGINGAGTKIPVQRTLCQCDPSPPRFGFGNTGRIDAQRTINASLRLESERVVNAREDDDELVPGIGCLCAKRAEVGGLSTLHIPHYQASHVECPRAAWPRVFQMRKNSVGGVIQRTDVCLAPSQPVD